MDRKEHYGKKTEWHRINQPIAAKLFEYKCQNCGALADEKTGVIHHTHYTGKDYSKTIEQLLSKNVAIKWLCKNCHKKEHIAYKRDEVSYKIHHSGFCAMCEKFAWHAWFKVELSAKWYDGKSNFPICNTCLKQLLDLGIMQKYTSKTLFDNELTYEYIYWGKLNNLNEKAEKIYVFLCNQIQKEVFGHPEWLKNNRKEEQLDLFEDT